jgi:hypothetical protein
MSRDGEETRRERPSETTNSRELTAPKSGALGADPQLDEETRTIDGDDAGPVPKGFPVDNWSRYEHVAFIGRGGMGVVFKARERRRDGRAKGDQVRPRAIERTRSGHPRV